MYVLYIHETAAEIVVVQNAANRRSRSELKDRRPQWFKVCMY